VEVHGVAGVHAWHPSQDSLLSPADVRAQSRHLNPDTQRHVVEIEDLAKIRRAASPDARTSGKLVGCPIKSAQLSVKDSALVLGPRALMASPPLQQPANNI
jgi:hypothetical protein